MIPHYVSGRWCTPNDAGSAYYDTSTGCAIFRVSAARTGLTAALVYAHSVGSPTVRALSRQQRARQLRGLGRDRAGLAGPAESAASMVATPADAARDLDGGHMALRHHAAAVAGRLPDADDFDDKVLVSGVTGPVALPDCFTAQDLVSFTGTRAMAARVRARLLRLTVEPRCEIAAEPLNCAVLGPDVAADDAAFRLFVERLVTAMTSRAGQVANQDGLPVTRYDLLALTARSASNAPITKENAC